MAEITDAPTIPDLLRRRIGATPDREAMRYRDGDGWTSLSWARFGDLVRELSLGLIALGVAPRERVAILSGTRYEWIAADMAALDAGAAVTSVYPTTTADECAYVLRDSGSVVVFAENAEQVAKLRSVREHTPEVRHVVQVEGEPDPADDTVLPLRRLAELGRERDPDEHERRVDAVRPDHLATLIYTSGTTGRPKGVELTHANWLYPARALRELAVLHEDDVHFLWLPLSHAMGKVLEIEMISTGMATAVDGAVERIAANMAELRPTIVAAAPRIFEKIHNTVVATVRADGGVKLALFRWARRVGARTSRARQEGRRPSPALRVQHAVADRLVFAKLRARLGGRIRYFVSGSAPLPHEVAQFFDGAGIAILEGYGLTESSAASFITRPGEAALGTVGQPVPGTRVRIAEDGEVLIRSAGVMRGYHGLPEETARTVVDGWLHTGDIGELDERGRLRITDRKKELIKTSGGKYVAPTHVEGLVKAACPYVSNVLVHGDRRNFCVALVTLDPDISAAWARERGVPPGEVSGHPEMRALVREAVDGVNARLARHETVKDFAILAEEFTVESGDLTPSMKLRRRAVEQRHRALLDSFYATVEHA
ncbi:AMP-dependent synthetase/ligase [Umezawaea beigongshangensis]|uniref:AMP-dependent synthetase/ligase n=1 Tax=Umezawaea beigongshangensis TaxID=2780383 RepID=UPI0018F1B524|nr:long-chain fatty acid--CoA ligase [Umezawaea beigongshangensis]